MSFKMYYTKEEMEKEIHYNWTNDHSSFIKANCL